METRVSLRYLSYGRCTSPGMTTVFYAKPYGRFIEITSNLKRNKLHRKNQSFDVFRGSFSDRDNIRAPIQPRRERQPQHLKR